MLKFIFSNRAICYGKMGGTYFTNAMLELSNKLLNLQNFDRTTSQYYEMHTFMVELMKVACGRAYLHCLFTFRSFQKLPSVDYQRVQSEMLTNESVFFTMVMQYAPKLFSVVREDYKKTMQNVFVPSIAMYLTSLFELVVIRLFLVSFKDKSTKKAELSK